MYAISNVFMFKTKLVEIVIGRKLEWSWDSALTCTTIGLTIYEVRKANAVLRSPESDDPTMQEGFCNLG